jgi:uncharacterized membrane protein HdeD (DUF308 family)
MQDSVSHPSRRWGKWFAEQWALFVVLGIVAGGMFWIARQALILGIVVGCLALVIGCVIGMTRLERWMEAGEQERQ